MAERSAAAQARRRQGMTPLNKITRHWELYLLILPPLIWVILFRYAPMYGLQIAFKNFKIAKGFWDSPWVGLKHFKSFFGSFYFGRLMYNTIAISLYSLIAGFFPPIILAVALNECRLRRFTKVVQTISYMPHFLSTVVVTSIVIQLLSYRGFFNSVITALGGTPQSWMGVPGLFKSIYVWSGVWQSVGYNSIIYLAALTGISPDLQEAATVDGANIWQRVWHVDIPGIIPTATIMLIMSSGSILNVGYEKVYLLQNDLNMSASDVISTYVYRRGLVDMDYSFSTAVNLFQSVISLAMVTGVNAISRRVSETSLW